MVHAIKSKEELLQKFEEAGDKLVVVDFFAVWCPPCKGIAPAFEEFSKTYPDVCFYKVDVDECEDLVNDYEVDSMPTFIFFKNKKQLAKIVGASETKIKEAILEHM